jgi:hypothetical protein
MAAAAHIYSVEDEGVAPPVVIEQRMPAMSIELQAITKAQKSSGAIDVVIDEGGRVVDATIRQSLNSSFDLPHRPKRPHLEVPSRHEGRDAGALPQDAHPGPLTSIICTSDFTVSAKLRSSSPRTRDSCSSRRSIAKALCNLEYGLSSAKPITVLIGEAGTGKSTLLRAALASDLCRHVTCVFLDNPTLTRAEFLETLAARFELGAGAETSKASLLGWPRVGDPAAPRAPRDHGAGHRRSAGAPDRDPRGDPSPRQHGDGDPEAVAGRARGAAGARRPVERARGCGS